MNKKINGKELPPCMIGTWAWGSGMNGSKMVFGKKYDKQQLIDTFKKAYELGFYMWDTAEVYGYGNSERILSECIKGKKDVFISTKHFPNKKYKCNETKIAFENSCVRLGVDFIDLYWLHNPNNLKNNIEESIDLLKDKHIGALGVSNVSLEQAKMANDILKKAGLRLSAIQNHFSLLSCAQEQKDIINWCNENNIVYFAYMVLEQGALSGHYNSKNSFPVFSMRGFSFNKKKFKKIEPLLQYEIQLANKYKIDTSQIPIIWAISKGTVPIIGLTKLKHTIDLSNAVGVTLSEEEIKALERLADNSGVYCKGSWEKS